MKKLAIVEEREEDKYEHVLALRWHGPNREPVPLSPADTTAMTVAEPRIKALIDGVMHSLSSARQETVKAWEEELHPCEHTLTLQQLATDHIPPSGTKHCPYFIPILKFLCCGVGLAHCSKCDLKENLWLCLTCGALGCGRKQYAGVGGNGHALSHFEESKHPVCVKLGTITPEGNAGEHPLSLEAHIHADRKPDIYCYACNEERIDTELVLHLSTFGINVQTQQKTEKSMTELVRPSMHHNTRR